METNGKTSKASQNGESNGLHDVRVDCRGHDPCRGRSTPRVCVCAGEETWSMLSLNGIVWPPSLCVRGVAVESTLTICPYSGVISRCGVPWFGVGKCRERFVGRVLSTEEGLATRQPASGYNKCRQGCVACTGQVVATVRLTFGVW